MRHLSVPSDQTQAWLGRCRSNGWLAETGVVEVDDAHRGLPLNDTAPPENNACWEGFPHVDMEPKTRGPQHWREHLPENLQSLPESTWPGSYETQGDVLIVKLEEEAQPHAKAIATAMLAHMPNLRMVCADDGVKGDFRVRDLDVILSRDGSTTTKTTVRENDQQVDVDPGEVYYSARLSHQRKKTYNEVQAFRQRLGRPVVVADPYAGVGPAFVLMLKQTDLLDGYLAGDLNPKAVELLEHNIARWTRKNRTEFSPATVVCKDARAWKDDPQLRGQADVVLVNLPHDSFDHLPDLFPLFTAEGETLLRGWAIVERTSLESRPSQLEALVRAAGGRPTNTVVSEIKDFSTTRCFVMFQTLIAWD
jgi:tRNA G37 N-methylase Trm5